MTGSKTAWRIILTIVLTLIISIFAHVDMKYILALGVVNFIAIYYLVSDKHLKEASDYILSDRFEASFSFIYKCFLINIGISIFLALVILTAYYRVDSETNISMLLYVPFLTLWVIIFLLKRYTNIQIFFCDSKRGDRDGSKK